jgi:hypothetical protein
MSSKLALVLVGLGVSCARAAAPPPSEPFDTVVLFVPAEQTTAAYGARVYVRDEHTGGGTGWIDVVASGTSERARALCALVAEQQIGWLGRTGKLSGALERGCHLEALPTLRVANQCRYLLVDPRDMTGLDVLLTGADDGPPPVAGGAEVVAVATDYWCFSSRPECDAALAPLLAAPRAADDAAARAPRQWLRSELESRQSERDAACQRQHDTEARCTPVLSSYEDLQEGCAKAPRSGACGRARSLAVDADGCRHELELATRSCAATTQLVTMIQARLDAPPPAKPSARIPECRPGSRSARPG